MFMPKRKVSSVNASLGHNLKRYRTACGFTQESVADLLNLNRTTYTKYETGASEPSYDIFLKMCNVFGVEPNDLLSDDYDSVKFADILQNGYKITKDEFEIVTNYRMLSDEHKREFQRRMRDFFAETKKKFF